MARHPVGDCASGQSFFATSATQRHRLGTKTPDDAGGEWIYLKGTPSVVQGSIVSYDGDFDTTLLTGAQATKGYPTAIFQVAVVANEFGWACRSHTSDAESDSNQADATLRVGIRCDASAAAETQMRTGSTAGQLRTDNQAHIAGSIAVRGIVLGAAQGGSAGFNTTACWDFLRSSA